MRTASTKAALTAAGNAALVLFITLMLLAVVTKGLVPSISARQTYRQKNVRDNIHQIQLAIERYATDQDGVYPYFLYGGELNCNLGTVNGVNTAYQHSGYPGGRIIQPFDPANLASGGAGYGGANWSDLAAGRGDHAYGDALQTGGYLPQYPRNPFQATGGNRFGLSALNTTNYDQACFGGRSGVLSWNLAWFGEAQQLMDMQSNDPRTVRIDFPGSFAYLPRWSDDVSNNGHLGYQISATGVATTFTPEIVPPLGQQDSANVASLDVAGYDLLGFGSDRDKGDCMDDSILDSQGRHIWRSGYLGDRAGRNPWVTGGIWNGTVVADFDPRPFSDGVDDFVIIHVGAGMDKRVANQAPSAVPSREAGSQAEEETGGG
ncbi:MAG: hypothetical protein H7A35_14915 [Planctomycetales bacterium]|nr:hypothetical protein [bacterium]UNM08122.1 MAG: hypothetical protein H7A35_14915 [Planctomycetales bacterium]